MIDVLKIGLKFFFFLFVPTFLGGLVHASTLSKKLTVTENGLYQRLLDQQPEVIQTMNSQILEAGFDIVSKEDDSATWVLELKEEHHLSHRIFNTLMSLREARGSTQEVERHYIIVASFINPYKNLQIDLDITDLETLKRRLNEVSKSYHNRSGSMASYIHTTSRTMPELGGVEYILSGNNVNGSVSIQGFGGAVSKEVVNRKNSPASLSHFSFLNQVEILPESQKVDQKQLTQGLCTAYRLETEGVWFVGRESVYDIKFCENGILVQEKALERLFSIPTMRLEFEDFYSIESPDFSQNLVKVIELLSGENIRFFLR